MNSIAVWPEFGYSEQTAAIASALVQYPSAVSHRLTLRLALTRSKILPATRTRRR